MYLDNKYTRWYYNIIKVAKSRTIIEDTESHHIIPESFFIKRSRKGPIGWIEGNPESPDNKVNLTYREHIICHILLTKMTVNLARKKMIHGLWMMTRSRKNSKRKKLTARQYEYARKEFGKISKEMNSHPKRPWTDEEKIRHSHRLKGIKKTDKTKENMKEAWKKRDKSVKVSTRDKLKITSTAYWSDDITRENQSKRRKEFIKENPSSVVNMVKNLKKRKTCEHCGIETNLGNYNRWHGEKCKLNKSKEG